MRMMAFILSIAAPLLGLTPQEDADKKAAELLRKIEDKVMKAKTVRLEFEGDAPGRDLARKGKLKGETSIGEKGAFRFSFVFSDDTEEVRFGLRSDGATITAEGPISVFDAAKAKPEVLQRCLRRALVHAPYLGCAPLTGPRIDPESLFEDLAPHEVKFEGSEKTGAAQTQIVSYVVHVDFPVRSRFDIRAWIDPEKLVVVRREITFNKQVLEERTVRFELDGAIPAGYFDFQSDVLVKEGLGIQLTRSVELHARFTGRLPKRLEDLSKRPGDLPAGNFWPEGGFWIGGAIPKDVPYSSDASSFTVGSVRTPVPASSPVAAPTDRLKKYFTARVQVQLIRAAAESFVKAYSAPIKEAQDLVRKPDSVRFWPEGGWIGGGRLPVDPWGDTYVVRGSGLLTIAVAKPKERALRGRDLTPEERRTLEDIGSPAPAGAEKMEIDGLIKKLGASGQADREEAMQALMGKGLGALRVVKERLASEKDPETSARLGMIRDQLRRVRPTWESELRPLRATFVGTNPGPALMEAYEKFSVIRLKTIVAAQADFRNNDRDGNGTADFWVRDVAGLYGLERGEGGAEAAPAKEETQILKLIEPALAKADTTEGRWEYPTLSIKKPESMAGCSFAALKYFEAGEKVVPYHKGTGRNGDKYGFVAYPSTYAFSGRRTFIVDHSARIWSKDLEGEEIDAFPDNPAVDGWMEAE